jgi:hypothetical protein
MKTLVKQIDTTGSTGSATGTADLQAHGERLVGVQVRYAAGQPATTDVTLTKRLPTDRIGILRRRHESLYQ